MGRGVNVMTCQEMVREFHERFDLSVRTEPSLVPYDEGALRYSLIAEELREYDTALAKGDIVEIADALADLAYVVYGAALTHGIDLDAVLREVHRSNMAKLHNGTVIKREDGKVLKPEGWQPPNIEAVLFF